MVLFSFTSVDFSSMASAAFGLALTGAFGLTGFLIGVAAVKSDLFREGAGLVLLFLVGCAFVAAAVGGILGALLPSVIGIWFGRAALLALLFAVGVFVSERR